MKIALLTIWHCYNYGAELQTYATVRKLHEMGHEVVVIDFRLHEQEKRVSLLGRLSDFLHRCTPAIRHFSSFWKHNIPTTVHYITVDELRKKPPIADLYLVGSDQVWNPQITKEKASTYYLDFVPKGAPMASYASSFGTDNWLGDDNLTEIVRHQLGLFKAISCRELQGCNLLRNFFHLEATHVLDPSMLHRDYSELTGKIKPRNTLAYYQLSENSALKAFAIKKAEDLKLKFVDVNHQSNLTKTFILFRPSIQQWVKMIAESQFVITHSFHGLVLCLLYHCQFVVIYDNGNKVSRLDSLLRMVGLEDRLFTSIASAEHSDVWDRLIDFSKVDAILAQEREKSINFLNQITFIE